MYIEIVILRHYLISEKKEYKSKMNLFTALSQGKGKLNEENMSAMLLYLLDPKQTHGLGDTVLKEFLLMLEINIASSDFSTYLSENKQIEVDLTPEVSYGVDEEKDRYIDIEISLFKENNKATKYREKEFKEAVRIGIENKINEKSADLFQFKEEYTGMRKEVDNDTKVIMIFLTPEIESNNLSEEFENLDTKTLGQDKSVRIYWINKVDLMSVFEKAMLGNQTGGKSKYDSIYDLIGRVLKYEAEGQINPISDYMRHTLKAFRVHIKDTLQAPVDLPKKTYKPTDIIKQAEVDVDGKVYIINQYGSKQIEILYKESGKPILEKIVNFMENIIKKKNLNVSLLNSKNNKKKARQLGSDVLLALNAGPPTITIKLEEKNH